MPGLPEVPVVALILTRCVHLGVLLMSLGLFPSSAKEEGWINSNVSNSLA